MSGKKDDWKVVDKKSGGVDIVTTIGGLITGISFLDGNLVSHNQNTYTVEDKWGNQHTVTATDEKDLGEKISKGKFDDKK